MAEEVIIIEDMESLAELMKMVLGRAGILSLTASSLAQAREILVDQDSIKLLIIDSMLPDGSGIEFARSFAGTHPDSQVLVVTGLLPEGFGCEFKVLLKPFNLQQFVGVVSEMLRPQ